MKRKPLKKKAFWKDKTIWEKIWTPLLVVVVSAIIGPIIVGIILKIISDTGDPATPPAEAVYISQSGHKYHRQTCVYAKIAISREDAKKQGYHPCKICRPDGSEQASSAINGHGIEAMVRYSAVTYFASMQAHNRSSKVVTRARKKPLPLSDCYVNASGCFHCRRSLAA
jgi:hypothetical protein